MKYEARIGIVFAILIFLIACIKHPEFSPYLIPSADFEEQESTMICWNKSYQTILFPMIRILSKQDHVTLFYNKKNNSKTDLENSLISEGSNINNITLVSFKFEKDNVWIRDFGPHIGRDTEGNEAILGFQYPHMEYGEYNSFVEQLSPKMKIPFYKSRIFGTGGGREINGKGTIILVEGYEKLINPYFSKAEVEQEYLTHFNQKKVIWLKKGIPQDDLFEDGPIIDNIYGYGVSGHTDEFCRFIDARTILITQVDSNDLARDPIYQVIHDRMEENYQILANATDQDGQPFNIIRFPQAPVIFADGKIGDKDILYTPVTSYLNFVISNKSVIVPCYYEEGNEEFVRERDEQAIAAFRLAFPTREIHVINATKLNYNGGGFHCITLSKPKKLLKLKRKKSKVG